jgi:hypothetical protein
MKGGRNKVGRKEETRGRSVCWKTDGDERRKGKRKG